MTDDASSTREHPRCIRSLPWRRPGRRDECRFCHFLDWISRSGDELTVSSQTRKNWRLKRPDLILTGVIESIREITDRKELEAEMINNRKKLSEIIDFLPDATFVIDTEGTVIAWNRAMEEMTGVGAAEMLGAGEYAYAIPFYGERKPMLANLVLIPTEELEARYDMVRREGDTLVVDISIPGFQGRGA